MALPRTSREARDILENLRRSTSVRPNLWTRAAIGYSLSLPERLPETHYDSDGTEFQERVLLGDDQETLLALVREWYGVPTSPDVLNSILKAHWERGLRIFNSQYQRLNRRGDELLLYLVSLCENNASDCVLPERAVTATARRPLDIRLTLGTDRATGQPVEHPLNGPGTAPHIAIMGRNGSGKTRLALSLLTQLSGSANTQVPALVFDYAKGDISGNELFIRALGANVVVLPKARIPLAPLAVSNVDEYSRRVAARRLRDTICSVVRLGAIQKDRCLQILEWLYQEAGDAPDLEDLVKLCHIAYEQEDWQPDSLSACIREFGSFPLFQAATDTEPRQLFSGTHVIDVHQLPEELRKLTVFLVLDRLYTEIMGMDDAPLDGNGNRQMRLVIMIDEAHHFLPCKQPTLEKMIREVRSKGVSMVLLSQSPDDFDQPNYNFTREIGLPIVFSCHLERPRMLQALLGGEISSQRLSQLPVGVALARVAGKDAPVEFQAWTP